MPKEQYREADVVRMISDVTFGVESSENMERQAHIQIVSKNLYNDDRTPFPYGVLDKRLGVNSKGLLCQTCGKNLSDCFGHFGFIDLDLPVFHEGYFRSIITILQCICKGCSKVLLTDDMKDTFRLKLINPNLSYLTRKVIRKKVIEKCKKVTKCPHCKEINGVVKKFTGKKGSMCGEQPIMKISHEKFRGKKEKDPLVQEYLAQYNKAVDINPDILPSISSGPIMEILTPTQVLKLFEKIPESDVLLLTMNPDKGAPKDLILTRMLVPPVCIRPSVVSDLKSGTNEDDLTMQLERIILINDELKKRKCSGAQMQFLQDCWDYLQVFTSLFFNSNLTGVPAAMLTGKPGRGLAQRLKGKQGRFRGNLSGKRVDFSSRTVISPDPNLEINQVGVPCHIAKTLTYPEYVNKANIHRLKRLVMNGPDVWPGAYYVQQKGSVRKQLRYVNRQTMAQQLKMGDLVERHVLDGDIVLFNRQPSLHKLSIMAHRAKVHNHKTLRFNECVCNPYNADFDGDEMNLHLPQTEEARAEALVLMQNKNNLVTPRNGELLIAATQDFLTGAFLLSLQDTFLDSRKASQLASALLTDKDMLQPIELPVPAILKPKRLWTGKQILSLVFRCNTKCPVKANLEYKGKSYTRNREFCSNHSYVVIRNSEFLAGIIDKGHLGSGGKGGNIFYVILRDFGVDHSITSMLRLAKLSSCYLKLRGFSIGIGDVQPQGVLVERRNKLLKEGYASCENYIKDADGGRLQSQPGCSLEETLESVILHKLSELRDSAGRICLDELPRSNSPLIMALSGSKGSVINIAQMVLSVGQQALCGKRVPDSFDRRSLPHFPLNSKSSAAKGFVENSFYSGLMPTECFFHTMGGREGLVDTAVKTAETGYMQRRLVKCLEDLVVHYDKTVRNAEGGLVQTLYGCDGLDPTYMEGKDCPVDFDRVLKHIQAKCPYSDEECVPPNKIMEGYEWFLAANTKSNALKETREEFQNALREYLGRISRKIDEISNRYRFTFNPKEEKRGGAREIERLTCSQLVTFIETCSQKYVRSVIEPGTAVGALAAQSIGEPGTQMTLKTFHFAGVASMNITQGVPRIREIINASKNISTPLITAELTNPFDRKLALSVKERLERTTLGEICERMEEVTSQGESYLLVKLNMDVIKILKLEVNAETIKYSLCCSKLKLKPADVKIQSSGILTVHPNKSKGSARYNCSLAELLKHIPNVIVKGLPTINRVVVVSKTEKGKQCYHLCVEGNNLREVMATYGINGIKTKSNNIMEIYETLGIEAARQVIMSEVSMVMENHGISVDYRHIMLLAAQMTHTGEVLGYTRQGLAKMKQSVFNLASFERTVDHLYDAAYHGQVDKIQGVSENIIMGMPAPVGTGLFKLLQQAMDDQVKLQPKELFFDNDL